MAMSLVAAGLVVPALRPAYAASLVQVTNFGNNPGGMQMHVYVPDGRPANPAIVVAMHGCGGSGPGFYSGSEFASLSDRYGFIVIYPTATQQAGFGNCFDVWSEAAKRRGGGSDPVSIMSMVQYAQQQYGGDPNRVYATGSSSGGMMTNHMLAVYPDVFKAGSAFMGVPYNCFANAADYPPWSSQCTGGNMNRTPQQWGDRRQFADSSGIVQVEAYSIQGAGHSLPSGGMAAVAIEFFGLTSTPPPTTAPPPPTAPPPAGACRVAATITAWNNGLTGNFRITNTGSSAVNGWSLFFTLPGGQTITGGWNASYSPSSGQVTARNMSYDASIPVNGSVDIGFQATHTGNAGAPSSFTLNGAACTVS
ncbi:MULTISPECIES: PHB depolymerase family esterase [unclassified Micromonospora]|uniref:extracellular catalytic domain type 1 short-chain-length polyhydroxyalkanoate depolymerase n=1 Tax=unclassified Micromonospora TaxID=2617518 RepID=UPI003A899434